jgi:hypothetical protein
MWRSLLLARAFSKIRRRRLSPSSGSPSVFVNTQGGIGLPDFSAAAFAMLSRVVRLPQWHVVADALSAYLGEGEALSENDRRLARALLRREI